jgi:hypothetical protein
VANKHEEDRFPSVLLEASPLPYGGQVEEIIGSVI